MIRCELLRNKGIAIISPEGKLEAGDLQRQHQSGWMGCFHQRARA